MPAEYRGAAQEMGRTASDGIQQLEQFLLAQADLVSDITQQPAVIRTVMLNQSHQSPQAIVHTLPLIVRSCGTNATEAEVLQQLFHLAMFDGPLHAPPASASQRRSVLGPTLRRMRSRALHSHREFVRNNRNPVPEPRRDRGFAVEQLALERRVVGLGVDVLTVVDNLSVHFRLDFRE